MPNHKSAKKRLKTSEKSRRRNMSVKTVLRKQLKVIRAAGEEAEGHLGRTHSELDKAARKGVIPRARAARLKSRTARLAARAKSS